MYYIMNFLGKTSKILATYVYVSDQNVMFKYLLCHNDSDIIRHS